METVCDSECCNPQRSDLSSAHVRVRVNVNLNWNSLLTRQLQYCTEKEKDLLRAVDEDHQIYLFASFSPPRSGRS